MQDSERARAKINNTNDSLPIQPYPLAKIRPND